MTIIILDSFSLIHRVYHALPAFTDTHGNPTGALYGFASVLIKLYREHRPDAIIAAFDTPEKTFREHEFAAYHANRPEMADDFHEQIEPIKDFLKTWNIPVVGAPGFEGDDVIGTLVHQLKGRRGMHISIVTADRDDLQLVGPDVTVLMMRKGITDIVTYDEPAAKEYLGFDPAYVSDYKALAGDASDNFPGVSGIGSKTAQALVQAFGTVGAIYDRARIAEQSGFEKPLTKSVVAKLVAGEAAAVQSKRLATIRTDAPVAVEDVEHLRVQPTDATKEFLAGKGFQSLVKRLDNSAQQTLL